MLRKIIFPLILGITGCAILIGLGVWQLQRLEWKEGILDSIETRLAAEPAPLKVDVNELDDEYSRVMLGGTPTGRELHVLTSGTEAGTGYRVISEFAVTDGLTILLDQGLLPLDKKAEAPLIAPMKVVGTLLWPDDQNDSTPEPDLAENIWFARNVPAMSDQFGTHPLMVVVSEATPSDPRLTPLPINTANIPNDHLEYAITWFLLALVWAAMTCFLLLRVIRSKDS